MQFFETIFLEEADEFIATFDVKSQRKIMFNVRIAEKTNDPELFKKLNANIWEFRTKFLGKQIRLLAFWDKTNKKQTLVLATSGFTKRLKKRQLEKLKKLKGSENSILRNQINIKSE